MERTEELVHNLFVAQNELIAHLANLKAVPNLAAVLFGTPEKNSTTEKNNPIEKNSTPEKNFSEMEKIRQTWMDDVVGLASEFYINEETFNLENLSELLKATVGAITDILELGPEKSSVNQTFSGGHVHANHEKKFTFLDKLKEDRPDLTKESDEYLMAQYCISEFGYGKECLYEEGPISERCVQCWNREFKYPDTDSAKPLTCREKAKQDYPDAVGENFCGGVYLCPHDYGYTKTRYCSFECNKYTIREEVRTACWDQPVQPKYV